MTTEHPLLVWVTVAERPRPLLLDETETELAARPSLADDIATEDRAVEPDRLAAASRAVAALRDRTWSRRSSPRSETWHPSPDTVTFAGDAMAGAEAETRTTPADATKMENSPFIVAPPSEEEARPPTRSRRSLGLLA